MHLCAELIAVSMMLEPLGEVGANFSLQLSSRTQFTKINNKKVIAENQCEKHKKSSLTRVDLNAQRVTKTYFGGKPLFLTVALILCKKNNLVDFPCEYTDLYLNRYTWYICICHYDI